MSCDLSLIFALQYFIMVMLNIMSYFLWLSVWQKELSSGNPALSSSSDLGPWECFLFQKSEANCRADVLKTLKIFKKFWEMNYRLWQLKTSSTVLINENVCKCVASQVNYFEDICFIVDISTNNFLHTSLNCRGLKDFRFWWRSIKGKG